MVSGSTGLKLEHRRRRGRIEITHPAVLFIGIILFVLVTSIFILVLSFSLIFSLVTRTGTLFLAQLVLSLELVAVPFFLFFTLFLFPPQLLLVLDRFLFFRFFFLFCRFVR